MLATELYPWLLPYDPWQVPRIKGAPWAIPPLRCTDERPMARQLPIGVVKGSWLESWQTAELPGVITGVAARTANGMAHNGRCTGTSITAGLSGLVAAYLVGLIMGGQTPQGLPDIYHAELMFIHMVPQAGHDHKHCAGQAALLPIYQAAAADPDQVLGTTLLVAPGVEQSLHGAFTDAVRQLVEFPQLFPEPGQTAGPQRALLQEGTPHAAEFLVAIQGQLGDHMLWVTEQAWEAGKPGYAQNVGLATFAAQLITAAWGGNADLVEAALLYFVGASVPFLPRPHQDVPLEIVRVH